MSKFIIQYLTTNRYGGLEDREKVIRADSVASAISAFQAKHPRAEVTFAEAL